MPCTFISQQIHALKPIIREIIQTKVKATANIMKIVFTIWSERSGAMFASHFGCVFDAPKSTKWAHVLNWSAVLLLLLKRNRKRLITCTKFKLYRQKRTKTRHFSGFFFANVVLTLRLVIKCCVKFPEKNMLKEMPALFYQSW